MARKPVDQSRTEWVKAGTIVNGEKVKKGYVAQKGKPEKRVTAKINIQTDTTSGKKAGEVWKYKAGNTVKRTSAGSSSGGSNAAGAMKAGNTKAKVTKPGNTNVSPASSAGSAQGTTSAAAAKPGTAGKTDKKATQAKITAAAKKGVASRAGRADTTSKAALKPKVRDAAEGKKRSIKAGQKPAAYDPSKDSFLSGVFRRIGESPMTPAQRAKAKNLSAKKKSLEDAYKARLKASKGRWSY